MELNFTFEINDWIAFQENCMKTSKQIKTMRLLFILSIPMMFLIPELIDVFQGSIQLNSLIFSTVFSIS